ncbi:hypothetical protein [Streptosporangium amethystogenes]|uniref:hypothetical protein n=1 Tax=Streptosporangium amethystogenes TaxID=2002 RepID=UPI0012FA78E8|nr:hypothetical protein [Streptosporangium amethystogenes]
MADPESAGNSSTMAYDHDQLQNQAGLGFADVSSDLGAVVKRALEDLQAIGPLPSGEEVDQRFLEWFTPKYEQMLTLTADLAGAYGDIGKGLIAMSRNMLDIDWGLAKSLDAVPDYTDDGPVKRAEP